MRKSIKVREMRNRKCVHGRFSWMVVKCELGLDQSDFDKQFKRRLEMKFLQGRIKDRSVGGSGVRFPSVAVKNCRFRSKVTAR
jgi:hypothetical protein